MSGAVEKALQDASAIAKEGADGMKPESLLSRGSGSSSWRPT
jgi:hypothetical protein